MDDFQLFVEVLTALAKFAIVLVVLVEKIKNFLTRK